MTQLVDDVLEIVKAEQPRMTQVEVVLELRERGTFLSEWRVGQGNTSQTGGALAAERYQPLGSVKRSADFDAVSHYIAAIQTALFAASRATDESPQASDTMVVAARGAAVQKEVAPHCKNSSR